MTARLSLPLLLLALVPACTSPSTSNEPDKSSAGSTAGSITADPEPTNPPPAEPELALPSAPAFTPGPFEVCYGKDACDNPMLPSKAFAVQEVGPDMVDHSWAFGWTTDGTAFAFCETVPECERCTFHKPDGTVDKLVTRDCGEKGTIVTGKKLREAIKERGIAVRDGNWAYGGELVVTHRDVDGARSDNDEEPRKILEVGAALRDGSGSGEVFRDDACFKGSEGGTMCFRVAHADAIAPSPDGTLVAILGHWWFGEWSDTFVVEIIPAGRFAAEAYNRKGLDALSRGDFEAAATAFVAVMYADPTAWKGPYNLACAYARKADPRVQLALQAAVERGGDAVREKAAKDKDLDSVRSLDWFTALIGK